MSVRSLLGKAVWIACLVMAVSGCERSYQRFVPYSDSVNTALDTKTGRICFTYPVKLTETSQSRQQMIAQGEILPLCYDLYKETK
jgi:hypothetical protein